MERDTVIALAREAGISESHALGMQGFLERFAALVAAAERKACIDICEFLINDNGSHDEYDEGCWDCAEFIRDRNEE